MDRAPFALQRVLRPGLRQGAEGRRRSVRAETTGGRRASPPSRRPGRFGPRPRHRASGGARLGRGDGPRTARDGVRARAAAPVPPRRGEASRPRRRGEPRVRALFENWLGWADSEQVDGGCVFLGLGHRELFPGYSRSIASPGAERCRRGAGGPIADRKTARKRHVRGFLCGTGSVCYTYGSRNRSKPDH